MHYELTATRGNVNLSGKKEVDFAIQINGQIPAPTLEFEEGDEAEIVVRNQLPDDELSLHWHGILLPPEMDGVSYVSTAPILKGQSHVFRFKLRQSGTYWYHSHTNVQEQKGVFGAFVVHPKKEPFPAEHDVVVLLSDWSDEDAWDILKNLRKDGDYYLHKKNTVRSLWGALQEGKLSAYFQNEWERMGGMDYSDVGYDAFLMNGKIAPQLSQARKGQKVRLRIINAAASSYFLVRLGQSPMKVIAADGLPIQPVYARELQMGMAETYDVLFEVPDQKNFELSAYAQDGTGKASGWIGSGERVETLPRDAPELYASMNHSGHGGQGGHSMHGMHDRHAMPRHGGGAAGSQASSAVETLTVDQLRAIAPTEFSSKIPVAETKLVLGGDMERYVWHINGKAIHQDRNIDVREGDVIRFVFQNETMMHHPMHLHGHFFRVLTEQGDYSPLKHTVDVPPHGSRTIEFLANEPGQWMLHCHNLYHMKNGMSRVVKYRSFVPKPEVSAHQGHDPHLHDHWYAYGSLDVASNYAKGFMRLTQTWNEWDLRVETRNTSSRDFEFNQQWEIEGDFLYRWWLGKFLSLSAGATTYDQKWGVLAGVSYQLPMMIHVEGFVDQRGKLRFDFGKKIQWTSWLMTDVDVMWRPARNFEDESDWDYTLNLLYAPSWSWGAGLYWSHASLGVGLKLQL